VNHRASLTISVIGTAAFVGGLSIMQGSVEQLLIGSMIMLLGAGFMSIGMAQW